MKAGWVETTLGEITELRPPKKQVKEHLKENDLVSFVPMAQLSEKSRHFKEAEKKPLSAVYKGYTYFADGDVLLAKITPCFENGKLGIAIGLTNGVGFGSSEYFVLRPSKSLDANYLTYFLDQENFRQAGQAVMGGAVGHKRVPKEFIRALAIPLPPLEEQKRIVAVLDEAFAALERARENVEVSLELSHNLLSASLESFFENLDCETVTNKLRNICSKIGSGATPRGGAKSYKSEGISLVRSLNIHDREFRRRKLAFIDDEQATKLSNVEIQTGDVLLNITGASVARCAIIPEEILPARVNQHVSIIRLNPDTLSSEYLNYLLTAPKMKALLLGIGEEGGSTRQAITKAQIQELEVSYPADVDDQFLAVERLKEIEACILGVQAAYREKLKDIADLRQSLLERAFAGELTQATPSIAINDNERDERLSTATLVLAYEKHCLEERHKTFGHVKAQKTLHLTESVGGLDLGRQPVVRQAGPHDQEHFNRVETWAVQNEVFSFVQRRTGQRGYDFIRGKNYDAFLSEAKTLLADYQARYHNATVDDNYFDLIKFISGGSHEILLRLGHIAKKHIYLCGQSKW